MALPEHQRHFFNVQKKEQIIKAIKTEAKLFKRYGHALEQRGRKLSAARYKRLQCDGYEEKTRNLIEAKGSKQREYIRMAVGQLLDYAFQAQKNPKLSVKHKAILLPEKLEKKDSDIKKWLTSLKINVVWPEKRRFTDNAGGRFSK
ncbi:MAG: hypothetical protein ABSG87_03830 [Verrucomicrobiota bacterium]